MSSPVLFAPPPAAQPVILLIATTPWMLPARLARKLCDCGFTVEAVCQVGHLLRLLKNPIRTHRLGWVWEERSIRRAIAKSRPSLIVPCDDASVANLHRIHARDRSGPIAALIEKSLGDPKCFATVANRSDLIALAHEMGLPAPRSERVASRNHLMQMTASLKFPIVLKRDHTWAGFGVVIVENARDLARSWSWIAGPLSLLRSAVSGVRHWRPRGFINFLHDRSATIELQDFIAGNPANRAVVCHKGKVLSGISVEVLETSYPKGPASVVRIIDNPAMTATVEALVGRLGLSGFVGFASGFALGTRFERQLRARHFHQSHETKTWILSDVATEPGRRIGDRLVSRVTEVAHVESATLQLEVRPENETAVCLYQRHGFDVIRNHRQKIEMRRFPSKAVRASPDQGQ